MTSPDFRFPLRVYWEDTDAGGVVFFANYLKFFERARTEWLRSLGFAQERLRSDTGAIFVVADTSVRFLSPARLDDLLQVTVQPARLARRRAAGAWRHPHRLRRRRQLQAPPNSRRTHSSDPMNQDLSIFTLVLHASFVVQLVIAGLLLTSLASWTVIFAKLFGLRRVRTENDDFEREFWAGKNLTELYNDAAKRTDTAAPMERIFASGMREFLKLRERRLAEADALLEGARPAIHSPARPPDICWRRSGHAIFPEPDSAPERPSAVRRARTGAQS